MPTKTQNNRNDRFFVFWIRAGKSSEINPAGCNWHCSGVFDKLNGLGEIFSSCRRLEKKHQQTIQKCQNNQCEKGAEVWISSGCFFSLCIPNNPVFFHYGEPIFNSSLSHRKPEQKQQKEDGIYNRVYWTTRGDSGTSAEPVLLSLN